MSRRKFLGNWPARISRSIFVSPKATPELQNLLSADLNDITTCAAVARRIKAGTEISEGINWQEFVAEQAAIPTHSDHEHQASGKQGLNRLGPIEVSHIACCVTLCSIALQRIYSVSVRPVGLGSVLYLCFSVSLY